MILVTGTMRSGTSLWMQLLVAAGFQPIGSAFPKRWAETLAEANPRGFYESALRWGVYYRTNPHPRTGSFLLPEATQAHLVKVFVPGLIRTDLTFVDHVVATMRPWREYVASIQRLRAIEAKNRPPAAAPTPGAANGAGRRPSRRERLPPEITWFFENYTLVRDIHVRRHPHRLYTYDRLLRDPESVITDALAFLGDGDAEAAIAAVDPGLRTQQGGECPDPALSDAEREVCDALYDHVDRAQPLPVSLLNTLNRTWLGMRARYPAVPEPDPWQEQGSDG